MIGLFASKLLTIGFVASVALWYLITPYLVQPHKRIVGDLLSKSKLIKYEASGEQPDDAHVVQVQNWTKWRLYVRSDVHDDQHGTTEVIYGSSEKPIFVKSKAVIHMEWRSDYMIVIEYNPDLEARIEVPSLSFSGWGIYNHFFVDVEDNNVLIVPRFLFGIPYNTIESLYNVPPDGEPDLLPDAETDDIVGRIPIIGLFSMSNTIDRIIIQIYMGFVVCSVIVLLVLNNPRETLDEPSSKDE